MPLAELREATTARGGSNLSFRIEGTVCDVSGNRRLLALHDDSETLLLGCPPLPADIVAGTRIAIEGTECAVTRDRYAIQLGTGPVIEVDGHHATLTRSRAVYLKEGPQAFRVDWFNGLNLAELALEYEGPGVPKQRVPASAYQHMDDKGATAPGLRYQIYEPIAWTGIAEIEGLVPQAKGVVADLDIGIRPRPMQVGMSFTGQLRIPTNGLYTFHLSSDDGARVFIGEPRIRYSVLADHAAQVPEAMPWRGMISPLEGNWVSASGRVTFADRREGRLELDLTSQEASFHVTVVDRSGMEPYELLERDVKLRGIGRAEGIIVVDRSRLEITGDSPDEAELLTRAVQIRRLQPEEARKAYRAKIRGVVTMSTETAVVIQDATGGVFVVYSAPGSETQPRPGEFWEIEGKTDPGDFSPMLYGDGATYLGSAPMPDPARPTWEQIASGGMDAELVELEGVVVSASYSRIILLTRDGRVQINHNLSYPLPTHDLSEAEQAGLSGSVVRIRGVFTANWDSSGRVNAGICQLGNATMTVDEPAPEDPFEASALQASDLLLFTSQPDLFRRVKVTGVVLHARPPEFFLTDGAKGFRVVSHDAPPLAAGDRVDAAGFPRLGGPSPMLMEAAMRKTGEESLPDPVEVPPDLLPNVRLDSTRVRLKASLLSDTLREEERVLEVQAGKQRFIARLGDIERDGQPLQRDSVLQLAGTYVTAPSGRPGSAAEPFELLLNGPEDLVVLQRGPWWTVRHTITVIAILSGGLLVALVWGALLRRTVALRTKQLAAEIEERQVAERHRALEQERTRVAQDLHDELGSGLTEAGILTSLVKNPAVPAEKKEGYLNQLGEVCSALVTGLDEIVWAVNPCYDSVADLAGYFSLFAQRFLELAGITCRLQIEESVAEHPLGSHQRHDIFLAFKEALNNIVRHSKAREVRLSIGVDATGLQIQLADDGSGFDPAVSAPGSDGLAGMKQRMKNLGGACRITSTAGRGTTVGFSLPLERSLA